jgi:hypothetical protein
MFSLTLLLQASFVAENWDVGHALQSHKEARKQAQLAAALETTSATRYLIAFSAHEHDGLVHSLAPMLLFARLAQNVIAYDVVLFLGSNRDHPHQMTEKERGEQVQRALHAKGFEPIEIIHMPSRPYEYNTPMEIFRNTYMAQEAVMNYRLKRGHYEQAWIVEQDVVFTGPWQSFFAIHDAPGNANRDLIAHVRLNEAKYHWKACSFCDAQDRKDSMTALLPISRYSLRLHKAIKAVLNTGLTGHHELLTHAVAKRNNMQVTKYLFRPLSGHGLFIVLLLLLACFWYAVLDIF